MRLHKFLREWSAQVHRGKWVVGSVLTGLVVLGLALRLGSHGGDAALIHACVSTSGHLRIVGATDTCRSNETPLDWSIAGPTGPAGPAGPPGPAGQVTGVEAFSASGTFTVPSGITRLLVEAWGAGGGGGGGGDAGSGIDGTGGAGGGGGAYVRTVVEVTPGATYTVSIGTGGSGGPPGEPGGAGLDTSFTGPDGTVLLTAGGGAGGSGGFTPAAGSSTAPPGGSGGLASASAGILVPGADGASPLVSCGTFAGLTFCSVASAGGAGGASVIGARLPPASSGGSGGTGGIPSAFGPFIPPTAGAAGGAGYLIIQF